MTTTQSSPNDTIRRALLKIEAATVLDAVDSLELRGANKVSAVVGVPLRNLQQRRDVESFATSGPLPAVRALLELLAARPLERVIHDLGDHASDPTYEQLSDAVDRLLGDGATNDDIVALLTFVIGEEFPASAHCRRLLGERAEFDLPTLASAAPVLSLLTPKEIDPDVREQRRVRREAAKHQKMRNTTAAQQQHPHHRQKKANPTLPSRGSNAPAPRVATATNDASTPLPIAEQVDDTAGLAES